METERLIKTGGFDTIETLRVLALLNHRNKKTLNDYIRM